MVKPLKHTIAAAAMLLSCTSLFAEYAYQVRPNIATYSPSLSEQEAKMGYEALMKCRQHGGSECIIDFIGLDQYQQELQTKIDQCVKATSETAAKYHIAEDEALVRMYSNSALTKAHEWLEGYIKIAIDQPRWAAWSPEYVASPKMLKAVLDAFEPTISIVQKEVLQTAYDVFVEMREGKLVPEHTGMVPMKTLILSRYLQQKGYTPNDACGEFYTGPSYVVNFNKPSISDRRTDPRGVLNIKVRALDAFGEDYRQEPIGFFKKDGKIMADLTTKSLQSAHLLPAWPITKMASKIKDQRKAARTH